MRAPIIIGLPRESVADPGFLKRRGPEIPRCRARPEKVAQWGGGGGGGLRHIFFSLKFFCR